jgi:hypothetical protein
LGCAVQRAIHVEEGIAGASAIEDGSMMADTEAKQHIEIACR